jgi:RNA-binding protein YhbY
MERVKMSKPIIKIVNAETGEEIEREMNAQELAQLQIDKANSELEKQVYAEAVVKKLAAQAKLASLGLTADDLKALGL